MASETGIKQVVGYTMLGIFMWMYRRLYFVEEWRWIKLFIILQLLIIVILSLFYQVNYFYLGFFTANFVSWFREQQSFRRMFALFSGIIAFTFIIGGLQQGESYVWLYITPFAIVMILFPLGLRSLFKHQELEMELDSAREQINELIKREERLRIARDLHDTLGHTLSLLTLKSQLVGRLLEKQQQERAAIEVKEMEQTSRAALNQVRELVADMRTMTLKEELIHVETILQVADIELKHEANGDIDGLPPLVQNIISYCIREAVTNIVRHSQASTCWINAAYTNGMLNCSVKDNGIGLKESWHQGNGMKGIIERISIIGGDVSWRNDEGTEIVIRAPIAHVSPRQEGAQA